MIWVIHTAAQVISEKLIVIGSVCKLDPIKALSELAIVIVLLFQGQMSDLDIDTGFAALTGKVNETVD